MVKNSKYNLDLFIKDNIEKDEIIKKFNENYYVTNKGRIFSYFSDILDSSGRISHKPIKFIGLHKDRYSRVKIYDRFFAIHRLVAQHFIPNPENKPEVNHIDFNTHNNNVSNLEWCTKKENEEWNSKNFRKINGIMPYGEKHYNYKINDENLKKIFSLREKGYSNIEISKMLNINKSTIYTIFSPNRRKYDKKRLHLNNI